MAATCRFDDEDAARRLRAGCPWRSMPASADESACARCPANAAWPGEATIGCRVALPGPVWKAATAELQEKAPALLDAVHALRRDAIDATRRAQATVLLDRWAAVAGLGDAGREAVAIGRAFLRAAERTGLGVRLWE